MSSSSTSSNTELITTVKPNDVILGRGAGPRHFFGNQQFLRLVRKYTTRYHSTNNEGKKTIAEAIVNHINDTLHGRFLKQNDTVASLNRVWCEVKFEVAVRKTKQALRDQMYYAEAADERTRNIAAHSHRSQATGIQQLQAADFQQQASLQGVESFAQAPPSYARLPLPIQPSGSSHARLLLPIHPSDSSHARVPILMQPSDSSHVRLRTPMQPSDSLQPVLPAGAPTLQVNNALFLTASGSPAFYPDLILLQQRLWSEGSLHASLQPQDQVIPHVQGVTGEPILVPGENQPPVNLPQDNLTTNRTSQHKRHIQEDGTSNSLQLPSSNADNANALTGFPDQDSPEKVEETDAVDFLLNSLVDSDIPRFTHEEQENEINHLTTEEREAVLADLFGNRCNISRSTKRLKRPISDLQSVDSLLERMRQEINTMPIAETVPLILALEKGSPKEFSDERMTLFLRREDMDARAAAHRFVLYWQKRLEWFGPDKFYLPMTQNGAFRDDHDVMHDGSVGILPNLDESGRQIIYIVPRRLKVDVYSPETILRLRWYAFEVASEHVNTDKGVILLLWLDGATFWNFHHNGKASKAMLELEKEAWPVKCVALHVCNAPSIMHNIVGPILMAKMDKRVRSRMIHHGATGRELVERLSSYGIPEEVIPKEMGGKSDYNHETWLAARQEVEENRLSRHHARINPSIPSLLP